MIAMPTKKKSPTKPSESFGQRLAELRRLRGFTQVQLAKTLNSTQRAIT
jgi:DNA-binding XRE family transcriptional regulator